ncbi:MAG: EAL domain-containing protein, partial [Pyrinomonadaceae bacterium]
RRKRVRARRAEEAIEMLTQLKRLNLRLTIDDFGTGYSSLSYLHRFPVDMLKIDRSFVSHMADNNENAEIVRSIITLASNLGMAAIAEGVESRAQMTRLRKLGCDFA